MSDRSAAVAWHDVKEFPHAWRVVTDAQVTVEEERGNFRGTHQVFQVTMRARDLFQLGLQLIVDRLQFLVDRLQFLLTGLQFLCGRTILLIDGLQLFVGGL